jgi:LAO/AO transport system kinase
VLAVDPSSPRTGGSILGDKTRMEQLAAHPAAFIRPSPSGGSLGGVAHRTRETMLVCEAAGFDVVIVETVGVGQSETAVASMVDTFVLLALPGSGDELQGIKKGIVELADIIAVNKADPPNESRAQIAMSELRAAVGSKTPMLLTSGLTGAGVPALWDAISAHRASLDLDSHRRTQRRAWFGSIVDEELARTLRTDPALRSLTQSLEDEVAAGTRTPADAARALIAAFRS